MAPEIRERCMACHRHIPPFQVYTCLSIRPLCYECWQKVHAALFPPLPVGSKVPDAPAIPDPPPPPPAEPDAPPMRLTYRVSTYEIECKHVDAGEPIHVTLKVNLEDDGWELLDGKTGKTLVLEPDSLCTYDVEAYAAILTRAMALLDVESARAAESEA